MLTKVLASVALVIALCLQTTATTFAFGDNNLTYEIQYAALTYFGSENGVIAVAMDARLTGVAPRELINRNNWSLEVDGAVVPNEPTRVTRDPQPSPGLIRFTVSEGVELTGHRVRFVFRGVNPNVTLDIGEGFTSIEVLFAKDIPADAALEVEGNWLIRTVDLSSGDEASFPPDDVTLSHPPNLSVSIPTLIVKRKLDPKAQRIIVRLQLPNFPEFAIGEVKRTGARAAFGAAKGKDDADIYFSGTAVGARGSKPLYSFESKLGYLFNLKRWGSLGPRAEVNAASESNVDPDSIKVSVTYEKIAVFGPAHGLILRSDAFGLEFDKENRNRNLTTGLDAILVLPPARLGESTFAAIDFLAGFEGGHNYRHKLDSEGLGALWRWKFGANAYFVALHPPMLKRIDLSTEYKVRLLHSAEPFTEVIDGKDITTLRKKPRHYVGSDLDFMFSDVFGITLKYRYGSLPPEYKFINNSVSAGITFKLKQVNK